MTNQPVAALQPQHLVSSKITTGGGILMNV